MIKVLWAVMCFSMHLPSRLECQQRGLNWNIPFILDNLIGFRRPADILIKVLSWLCLEIREGLLPMSQKLGSSLIYQASERERSSLRWAPGQLFEIPEVRPDLPCLSGLLMTLSWVGSRVLAPGILTSDILSWETRGNPASVQGSRVSWLLLPAFKPSKAKSKRHS